MKSFDDLIPQATLQLTPQVNKLLATLKKPMSKAEIMKVLKLKDVKNFRNNYLHPALHQDLITMTKPNTPNSPTQKYQKTVKNR